MTKEEVDEIQLAVDNIKHVTDGDPLTNWKYDMLRAVLPLLERALYLAEYFREMSIMTYALQIARVVNQKT